MTACRVPDCGATTDGFLCVNCGKEIARALRNPRPGDPDIVQLMAAVSVAATGRARVYRASRRASLIDTSGPTEPEYLEAEFWRTSRVPSTMRTRDSRIALPSTAGVVNEHARDLLDEAWNLLTTWARHLAETRGVDFPTPDPIVTRILYVSRNRMHLSTDTRYPRISPRELADWLADRVNSIRHDEAAADAHAQITALRDRLLRAVDRGSSRVYAGPCDCGRALYATFVPFRNRREPDHEPSFDERTIVCDGYRPPRDPKWDPTDEGCGAEHRASGRRDWLIADLADRLYSITFWAYWLPLVTDGPDVPHDTIVGWSKPLNKRSPRLVPHAIDRDAVELFRGGDVMDLMRQYRPKRYAPRPNRRTA